MWIPPFAATLLAALLSACAHAPALGPGPSDADIGVGERAYPYARQTAGGDLTLDPALSAYVSGVGRKLAAVSDRPGLPYDFVLIDNAVPNAWALPGGKIGIHRALLAELDSEAELAAVLAREIAHAAQPGEAKKKERTLWFNLGGAGLPTAAGAGAGREDLVVGGARIGAVLGRRGYVADDVIAADRDAMRVMARAGYDPAAQVALLERFLNLHQTGGPAWQAGLLAAEPPSEARLAAAREALRGVPAGGVVGTDEYRAARAPFDALGPAFERRTAAERALARGDAASALPAAREAADLAPADPRAHLLAGMALLALDRPAEARDALDEAVRRGSDRFLPWLVRGEARQAAGDTAGARDDFMHSLDLLPTDTVHLHLGRIDLAEGRVDEGKRHLRAAREAGGRSATAAGETLARLELLDVPGRYVAVGVGLTPDGFMFFTVQNRAPLPVRDVKVHVSLVDPATGAARTADFTFDGPFGPEERVRRETHFGPFSPEVTRSVRTEVVAARLVE